MNFTIIDIETIAAPDAEKAMEPFLRSLEGKQKRTRTSTKLADFGSTPMDKADEALSKAALTPVGGQIASIQIIKLSHNLGGEMDKTFGFENKTGEWISEEFFLCYQNEDKTPDEKEMLIECSEILDGSTIVTFNGRQFDGPFLMFRAAILGVNFPLIPTGKYNRNDGHLDMKIFLEDLSNLPNISSDFSMKSISLKKWIEYFGLGYDKPSIAQGHINIEECLKTPEGLKKLEQYGMDDVRVLRDLLIKFINYVPVKFSQSY